MKAFIVVADSEIEESYLTVAADKHQAVTNVIDSDYDVSSSSELRVSVDIEILKDKASDSADSVVDILSNEEMCIELS